MSISRLLAILGLVPSHPYSLYVVPGILLMWLIFWPLAALKSIRIFYRSSLVASIGEELIFRGAVYGGVAYYTHSPIYAVVVSSLTFGLFHLRNLWWAGWRRSWHISLYTGLSVGPVLAVIRLFYGDIYMGMAFHFVHNFFVMFPPPGMKERMAPTPKDNELKSKSL